MPFAPEADNSISQADRHQLLGAYAGTVLTPVVPISVEEAIVNRLACYYAGFIHPVYQPQRPTAYMTKPWAYGGDTTRITYKQLAGDRIETMAGPVGMACASFEITCWGNTMARMNTVSYNVRNRLSGYSGTISNIVIHSIQLQSQTDVVEIEVPGPSGLRRIGRRMVFDVWFNETA
jgi:hypothetical protein